MGLQPWFNENFNWRCYFSVDGKDGFGCPWKFVRCLHWLKERIFTSTHPQLSVNMQFALVQSSHMVGFSRDLTKISIGGAIPWWIGRMGLVSRRSLYAVCTNCRTTFLTSPHPQLSVNMPFPWVESSHRGGFNREFTRIFIGGAIPWWMWWMVLMPRRRLYAVSTNRRTKFLTSPHPQLFLNYVVCFSANIAPGGL